MTREKFNGLLADACRWAANDRPEARAEEAKACSAVLDAFDDALAQPPGPAPSMEEVERLVDALIVTKNYTKHDPDVCMCQEQARSALLAAIRALPDRYAEGAEAMRLKAQRYVLAVSKATGDGASLERTAEEIGSLPLPTPNPEDRR